MGRGARGAAGLCRGPPPARPPALGAAVPAHHRAAPRGPPHAPRPQPVPQPPLPAPLPGCLLPEVSAAGATGVGRGNGVQGPLLSSWVQAPACLSLCKLRPHLWHTDCGCWGPAWPALRCPVPTRGSVWQNLMGGAQARGFVLKRLGPALWARLWPLPLPDGSAPLPTYPPLNSEDRPRVDTGLTGEHVTPDRVVSEGRGGGPPQP